LTEYICGKDIDEFLFSKDGSVGYLSCVNSNILNIVDLKTGKEIKTVKISNKFFLGKPFLNFWRSGSPPVIQSDPVNPFERISCPENRRMFFSKDASHLYILARAPEVSVIDLQTNEVKSVIKFKGNQYGIHLTPDKKYIVVTTNMGWHLLDPSQTKPILSFTYPVNLNENEQGPENGYYSPNGNLLIVPFKKYLYLIDPVRGISIGKTRTKAITPLIVWPE
jgi:hypothetical protein